MRSIPTDKFDINSDVASKVTRHNDVILPF